MEPSRLTELYVPAASRSGGNIGSGYAIGTGIVLTAEHVVADLPTWPAGQAFPLTLDAPGSCRARPLGLRDWAPAVVVWRDAEADVAVLHFEPAHQALSPLAASKPVRWGRIGGTEQIAVTAVGFPWAQESSERARDTEQLFGFIAPATTLKAGLFAITVHTTPPADRERGSPWAGMSGAALFAGPFLVGVVVIDPARFGPGRVAAAPVAPLLGDVELLSLLGADPDSVREVGPQFRLALTADTSIAVTAPYQAPTPRLGREPARLLLPEFGIVPFAGRQSDLEDLEGWCLGDPAPALRVLTGSGGSGKTRLAAETCVRMIGHGWQAGFANEKAPGGQAQLELNRPTVLVVDDADLNVELLTKLIRVVGAMAQGPPVRLLLLARHLTSWWETLNQQTASLASELADTPLTLHEGDLAPDARAGQHARALAAFSERLPADGQADTQQAPPSLEDPAFASPLLVHMHALLTASGANLPTVGGEVRERILDAVLDREQARWNATFPPGIPTAGIRTRHQLVTVATLLSPSNAATTAQAISTIDELRPDAAAGARAALATWLHDLYPGGDPPWVAPLRPDLLTEQLLARCPQLSELTLACYENSPEQASTMLAELTRASSRAEVHEALTRLLVARLPDLLAAAIDSPASGLADLLDISLRLSPQPAAAADLVSRLPERGIALAALAVTLTAQASDHYRRLAAARPDAFTPDLAGSLNNLSNRLGDLGRREDALAAIEEAVSAYRQLATARPDAFIPALAVSLNTLSIRLGDLGRREDALAASQEAVTLRRQLAAARPDAFIPTLATSLHNLSVRLGDLGRPEDALAASQEAVTAYRQLATARPDAFIPALAVSLNTLSIQLGDLGRREDALAASQEAVTAYRQLAAARPDAFIPDLAVSLNNLSNRLGGLGRPEDALAAIEEAVSAYRQLATARPDAFIPALADSLNNLSVRLGGLGRREDALAAIEEAVTAYRQLAAARPDAFIPALATSLNTLSNRLGGLGRREDSLAAIEEAVTLRRQLAAARPDAFNPDLAGSLHNLSIRLGDLGRPEDALAASQEAVTAYRQLAAARPDAFIPDLAMSLNNLSIRLGDLGRPEDALAASQEAVTAYRQLAAARPDAFIPDLATSLHNLSVRLGRLGRPEDALAAGQEAVTAYRQLAAARPDAFIPDLADSLHNLSIRLGDLGRPEDALAASQEAVTLQRQSGRHRPSEGTAI